jgi:hypothetical protein
VNGVRTAIEFIKGKGKALQKAMVVLPGQVGWRSRKQTKSSLCFKAF